MEALKARQGAALAKQVLVTTLASIECDPALLMYAIDEHAPAVQLLSHIIAEYAMLDPCVLKMFIANTINFVATEPFQVGNTTISSVEFKSQKNEEDGLPEVLVTFTDTTEAKYSTTKTPLALWQVLGETEDNEYARGKLLECVPSNGPEVSWEARKALMTSTLPMMQVALQNTCKCECTALLTAHNRRLQYFREVREDLKRERARKEYAKREQEERIKREREREELEREERAARVWERKAREARESCEREREREEREREEREREEREERERAVASKPPTQVPPKSAKRARCGRRRARRAAALHSKPSPS